MRECAELGRRPSAARRGCATRTILQPNPMSSPRKRGPPFAIWHRSTEVPAFAGMTREMANLSPGQKTPPYSPHQPGSGGVVTINCPVIVGRPLHRRKEAGLGDGFVAAMSPWETPFARNPGVPRRILSRYFYYFEAESVSGHHHRPKTGSGDAVWLRGVPGRQIRSSGAN